MSESEWTKILGWPGYRVYRSEINEDSKTVRLWVRRKRGNRKLVCSGHKSNRKLVIPVPGETLHGNQCHDFFVNRPRSREIAQFYQKGMRNFLSLCDQ